MIHVKLSADQRMSFLELIGELINKMHFQKWQRHFNEISAEA
jgi:hypothetical protein